MNNHIQNAIPVVSNAVFVSSIGMLCLGVLSLVGSVFVTLPRNQTRAYVASGILFAAGLVGVLVVKSGI